MGLIDVISYPEREVVKAWLQTEEALEMALAAAIETGRPKRKWWQNGEPDPEPVRIVYPRRHIITRLDLVGADEKSLSPRELPLLDSGHFGLATWNGLMRTLVAPCGVGVVVPEDMTIVDAAFALTAVLRLRYPEQYIDDTLVLGTPPSQPKQPRWQKRRTL